MTSYRLSEGAEHLRDLSTRAVYLLADSCPTCDSVGRELVDGAHTICKTASQQGHPLKLIVIMQGNTLYDPLHELYQAQEDAPALPAIYYWRRWYTDTQSLAESVMEDIKL